MENKADSRAVHDEDVPAEERDDFGGVPDGKIPAQEVQIASHELNRIDLHQLSRSAFKWKSKATLRLIACVLVQGMSNAAYAVDGSVTSGLSALPAFRDYFGVGTSGAGIGLIVAGMSIGNACASLFQFLSDIIGRRGVTFLGNAFMLLGCVLQAAAPNTACFVMGRIVQGVGASLSATCGPLYMTEIAPSCYRGMMVGAFAGMNTFGAVAIACALLGGSYLPGEWSWRMPIMLQLLPSTLVCVLIYLITPESPRYLVSKGRTEQARKILAQLHTQSESMSEAIVAAEMAQIEESLELIDNKPWDYSTFWNNRAGKRRLWIIFIYSLFQQWNGTGLLGAFVPAVLELVGISNSQQQLGYNLGLTCIGLVALVIGTTFVDRVRRRYLLLGSLALYILFFSLMIVWSGLYAYGIATYPMGIMIVVTMFLFNTATGLFVNIVHNIYPNEVFHYKQRAKGMGLFSFFQNCFGFAMIYGGAQALAVLQWKVYFIFIGLNILFIILSWLFFPEFRWLSLEEIDLIMDSTTLNPVKMSLELQKAKAEKRQEEREQGVVV